MRSSIVARNYAEALFTLGEQSGQTEQFAGLLEALAGAIEADDRVRTAMESPRVPKARKASVLRSALEAHAPEAFLRFIDAVVKRGRQGILGAISHEFNALVDVKFNRVHAGVTLAREPDAALLDDIRRRLSEIMGKEVIPHVRHDPAILGGILVRVGDRVMDGSLRRKIARLRRQMLGA